MITWITPAGRLGIITERFIQNIPLEASSDVGPITFSLIAGRLPRGLRLDNTVHTDSSVGTIHVVGSPTEVKIYTESKFVIRASDGEDIEDRTFTIDVDGSDAPLWVTKEGFLNVGQGQNYFVLDNSYVDFQLEAEDQDENAGDVLEYYLIPNGGEIPPGLILTRTGRIVGFTDPIFAINVPGPGGYDTAPFDYMALDVAKLGSNGFDTYLYDNVTYDYSEPGQSPRRLSRFYTFIVGVSDGANEVRRLFRIWVVTEEFLKADNTIVAVDTNLFRADNTGDRVPIWITESNLGRWRANNYLTIYLDVYDPPTLSGTITYILLPNNPDGSNSVIPPGMELDSITGEIAGRVPYQSAVTKRYTFTMQAVNYPAELYQIPYIELLGNWNNSTTYTVGQAVRHPGAGGTIFVWICVVENINQIPNQIDSIYWVRGISTKEKTFFIDIIGEIESAIEWVSDSDLGTIAANQPSQKYVQAKNLNYKGTINYELVQGSLPPGLEFISNGLITGKVKQFSDVNGSGLTRFYERADSALDSSTASRDFTVSFDGNTTSFDKTFNFSIKARDYANFSESIKSFKLLVVADNTKTFANLYLKAFQVKDKRLYWYNFITDNNIFKSNEIYRYEDPNFGIQTELKILLFAGIESVSAVKYVQAMSRNHYKKQILFGDVTSAIAKDPITQEIIYEVVYIEMVDELEKNGSSISQTIELPNNINSKVLTSYDAIKVDSDIPLVSDSDHQKIFPNSLKNMRKRINTVGERDRNFLPLWMRTIQNKAFVETGYVKALVLCYTKPGFSSKVISRIKLSNFDFKMLNFTADRYLIDIIDGVIENKYLAFPQRGEKLP